MRQWAKKLKFQTFALYLAYKDPRTPWYAKLFAACVVGYAFSPIDLIPDFIPILGLLDDLIIVPIGIALALKMIPAEVIAESQAEAQLQTGKPTNYFAAVIIVTIWLFLAAFGIWIMLGIIRRF